jgi:hypothetical protein
MELLGASGSGAPQADTDVALAQTSQAECGGRFYELCKALIPDPKFRQEFIDSVNRMSTDQFRTDQAGYLQPTGEVVTGGRHSPEYGYGMKMTIDAPGTATFQKADRYPSTQADGRVQLRPLDRDRAGGVTIFDGRGNADVYLSGNPNLVKGADGASIWMEPDETQEHEIILHAATINPEYRPEGVSAETYENGSAIPFENRVRRRQGLKPREFEQAHGFKRDHAAPPKPKPR